MTEDELQKNFSNEKTKQQISKKLVQMTTDQSSFTRKLQKTGMQKTT